jgi:hypothetical protein
MKHYSPTGRRNHDRPLKRLLDTWVQNRSTSGPTPWQIYDDDDRASRTVYYPDQQMYNIYIYMHYIKYCLYIYILCICWSG